MPVSSNSRTQFIQKRINWKTAAVLFVLVITLGLWCPSAEAYVAVKSAEFSPDGTKIAFNLGNEIAIFDVQTGNLSYLSAGRFSNVKTLKFTPDSDAILLGKINKVTAIYRFTSQRPIAALATDQIVTDAAFLSDGKTVLIGTWDGTLEVWDYQHERRLIHAKAHMFGEVQIDVSDDEKFVVSAGDDQTVRLWRLKDLEFIRFMKDGRYGRKANRMMMRGVSFVAGGSAVLASGWLPYCRNNPIPSLQMFNTTDGRQVRNLVDDFGCGALAFSLSKISGRVFVSDGSNRLTTIDVGTWRISNRIGNISGRPAALALSPNGRLGVTATSDEGSDVVDTRFWNIESGNLIALLSFGYEGIKSLTIFRSDEIESEIAPLHRLDDLVKILDGVRR